MNILNPLMLEFKIPAGWVFPVLESFRFFRLNIDIINHHVTPSAGNAYTLGTMLIVSVFWWVLSLFGDLFSTFHEFPGLV